MIASAKRKGALRMKNEANIKKHRLFYILLLIVAALILLNLRLFWIQVAESRNWTGRHIDLVENSVIQREKGMVLDSGRGDFYDRNGHSLTGKELSGLTVFPVRATAKESSMIDNLQISQILRVPEKEWRNFFEPLKSPRIWSVGGKPVSLSELQKEQITALRLPQLSLTPYKQRYGDDQIARHVIGYIGQNPERITRQYTDQFHNGDLQLSSKIGGSGLERTFDPWLQGIGATSISLFTDAMKLPLPGLGTREVSPNNNYYPLKLITTLDDEAQRKTEGVMDKLHIREGAVVVLDAENADVVAMASRPNFDPEHIDLQKGNWGNLALKSTAPGSIFKTVTAAAALEEGAARPDEMFDCSGELGKYGLTCWKKEGHGRISFREGYAESCNIVFAKIAERLDGIDMETYANKLGLGVTVGWQGAFMQKSNFHEWDAEDKGQIFAATTPKQDGGVKAQSAIGQRDVMVTPLQAANMIVTLLGQGVVHSPRIVKEVRFQNDRLMESLPESKVRGLAGSIKGTTARRLLAWMGDVVDHGTGKALQSAVWSLAGKSGTAQITDTNHRAMVNQWFIGYGPVEKPKYAVAVLVPDIPENAPNVSIPLFREVVDALARQ
jgi:cell division protein FtsI/penicillin-binding protein 2